MLRQKAIACLNTSRILWFHSENPVCQAPAAAGTCKSNWLIGLLGRIVITPWPELPSALPLASSDSNAAVNIRFRHTAADTEREPAGSPSTLLGEQVPENGTSKQSDGKYTSSAAVLVRDSSSLKPRLLKATNPPPAEQKPARRRRRHDGAAVNTITDTGSQLSTESELQYFTSDVTTSAMDAGFAAAQFLQSKAIDEDLSQQSDISALPAAHVESSLANSSGDSLAALLEMQQLQELRERHGGVLAPEDFEVVQVAKQRAARKLLPLEALASAVMNALQVGKKYGVDPKVLLTPRIAEMRTDLLQARAAQIKRMLPDAQLQEELLARGAEEVSGKITRIISTFRKQLGMDAPAHMLTQPGTFAKALRLPDERLESHLDALQRLVGGKVRAQELVNMYTNTVFSNAFPNMLKRMERVASTLQLTQDEAVEIVLRFPFMARTHQQLLHVEKMVQSAPSALRLPEQLLLSCFIRHPELFRYSSSNALAQKYHALAGIMQVSNSRHKQESQEHQLTQAGPAALLDICSSSKVRQAVSMEAVAESLRTAAAIMNYKSPAELLPMLLQAQSRKVARGHVYGSGSRPLLNALLQPAEKLAARAGFRQQQLGLSRQQVARQVRWFPVDIFCRDIKTRKLKHAVLQGQLLGTEIMADDQLDPRMTAVLRKSPMVGNLQVDTALQRIHSLEAALQLQQGQAKQMVLRLPQLLVYNPAVLQELMHLLVRLLGGNLEASRELVLQDPKVVVLLSQYRSGSLRPKLSFLQSLLSTPNHAAAHHKLQGISAASASASAQAAVTAVTARAASNNIVTSSGHGMTGVRRKGSGGWECRSYLVYDNTKQYSSQHGTALEAACAQDLIRLAVKGPGAAVNLNASMYTAAEVEAMALHLQHQRLQWHQQQQQQQPQQMQYLASSDSSPQHQHHYADLPWTSATGHHQQQQQDECVLEALFTRCLATKAGRQLLTCTAQTAQDRLNVLADLLGLGVRNLLEKGLTSSNYLQGVLGLSPARMEAAAVELQQQLDLSLPQVQQVLKSMPVLLLYKQDVLKAKTGRLISAFANCCYAVQQTLAVSDSSAAVGSNIASAVGTSCAYRKQASGSTQRHEVLSKQQRQHQLPPPVVLDAVACLQRAILYAPQLLALKVERVTWRLQVLEDVCCHSHTLQQQGCQQDGSLAQQLQEALHSGSLGRWLLTGDATYEALLKLGRAYQEHGLSSHGSSSSSRATRSNMVKQGVGSSLMPRVWLHSVLRMNSTNAAALLQGLVVS